MIEFKQMGVGLAAAILIDATVIRGVLLPATLALLGDRAWYLPAWLEWLPGAGRSSVAGVQAAEAAIDRAGAGVARDQHAAAAAWAEPIRG